jgi:hypothetical protein
MEELMIYEQTYNFFPEEERSRTERFAQNSQSELRCCKKIFKIIENVTFVPVDITYEFPFE